MGKRRVPRQSGTNGRPYAITPEKRKTLLTAVRVGVPVTHAAAHADLSVRSVMRYLQRGQAVEERIEAGQATPDTLDPEDEYFWQLWQEIIRARASVAVRNATLLQKAAEGGYVRRETKRRYRNDEGVMVTETERVFADVEWRAAMKLLEVSFPKDFHQAHRVELGILEPVGAMQAAAGVAGAGGGMPDTRAIEDLAKRLALIAERRENEGDDLPEDVVTAELVEDDEETLDESADE